MKRKWVYRTHLPLVHVIIIVHAVSFAGSSPKDAEDEGAATLDR
jgi:hypothetical protein